MEPRDPLDSMPPMRPVSHRSKQKEYIAIIIAFYFILKDFFALEKESQGFKYISNNPYIARIIFFMIWLPLRFIFRKKKRIQKWIDWTAVVVILIISVFYLFIWEPSVFYLQR